MKSIIPVMSSLAMSLVKLRMRREEEKATGAILR